MDELTKSSEALKEHLREIVRLESARIVAEKSIQNLDKEKQNWLGKASFVATKGKMTWNWNGRRLLILLAISATVSWTIGYFLANIYSNIYLKMYYLAIFSILNPIMKIILCFFVFVGPFVLPIYLKYREFKKIQQKYNEDCRYEANIKAQSKKAIEIIEINKNKLLQARQHIQKLLEELYGLDVLYKKYRNFEACSSFLEYLEAGRCTLLQGPDGAYNLYESEANSKQIIEQLRVVNTKLDTLIQQQSQLNWAVKNIVVEVSNFRNDLQRTFQNMEGDIRQIANNTMASAWATEYLAYKIPLQNEEILRRLEGIHWETYARNHQSVMSKISDPFI